MKSQKFKLFFFSLALPFLFLSCAKEDIQGDQSEIVFKVPMHKDEGSSEYSDIIVYPNPFWDEVHVSSHLLPGDSAEVQLSDAEGKFSLKLTITEGAYGFDTENFPIGVYYIEIKKDGYVDRAKLLKINRD